MFGIRMAAAAVFALAGLAHAGVIFSENFDSTTPGGGHGAGNIAGSGFRVTGGNVDVMGDLNGSFFTCATGPNSNCLDMVGTTPGTIETIATFNLLAGYTYTLTFDSAATGAFTGGGLTFGNHLDLGPYGLNFWDTQIGSGNYPVTPHTMTVTPVTDQLGVRLTFQAQGNPGPGYWGSMLDNVVLTETAPQTGAPEPGTVLVGAAGLVLAVVHARRARRV